MSTSTRVRRTVRRFALAGVAIGAAAALSGCVAIKSQSASQRLPGFVTLNLTICVSSNASGTTCDPDVRGGTTGTAEDDNGFYAGDDTTGRGQLLLGFRVPDGTGAPSGFSSSDGRLIMSRHSGYTDVLESRSAAPPGYHWVGYISGEVPFDATQASDRQTTFAPEFRLPRGAGGGPSASLFLWRAAVGTRATGGSVLPTTPLSCAPVFGYDVCVDSPSSAIANHLSATVSDVGVLAGGTVDAAPGQTATVSFSVRNADAGALGPRTLSLAATTTVPRATAKPAAATLAIPANQARNGLVRVTIPPGTPVGSYKVELTGTANAGGGTPLTRSNTGTIRVVDRTAPQIRVSSPVDGAAFTVGQSVAADFGCVDEAGGSGVASCGGPVGSGAAIDTGSAGTKTFTVSSTDAAGNASAVTHTYTVNPPPAVQVLPASRFAVTIAYNSPRPPRRSTTFNLLQVKNIPSGATVTVTCKGRGCPKQKGKPAKLTKRNARGTLSLKPWLRRPLRAGTVLTVTVTKDGFVGVQKLFTVRRNARPRITDRCLEPGSTTRRASCT